MLQQPSKHHGILANELRDAILQPTKHCSIPAKMTLLHEMFLQSILAETLLYKRLRTVVGEALSYDEGWTALSTAYSFVEILDDRGRCNVGTAFERNFCPIRGL